MAVAPYFHAKLQSHRLGGDPDLPMAIRVVDLSDSQINALIERIRSHHAAIFPQHAGNVFDVHQNVAGDDEVKAIVFEGKVRSARDGVFVRRVYFFGCFD